MFSRKEEKHGKQYSVIRVFLSFLKSLGSGSRDGRVTGNKHILLLLGLTGNGFLTYIFPVLYTVQFMSSVQVHHFMREYTVFKRCKCCIVWALNKLQFPYPPALSKKKIT